MLRNDYKPKSIRQSGQYLDNNKGRRKYRLAVATSVIGVAILAFSLTPTEAPASLNNESAVFQSIDLEVSSSQQQTHAPKADIKVTRTAIPLGKPVSKTNEEFSDITNQTRYPVELNIEEEYLNSEFEAEPVNNLTTVTIKSGDNLANIFSKNSIPAKELQLLMKLGKEVKALTKIMPGKTLDFVKNPQQQLIQIRYPLDGTSTLIIDRGIDSYTSHIDTVSVLTELVSVKGTITDSLFLSGKRAGLSDNLIMQLAGIFGWDIDFILDIRKGDRFSLVYEKRYGNGEFLGDGSVVAAEFVNQGKSYRAVNFSDSNGNSNYYTPEGLSMRKTFLRAPLNFLYVSSKFNPKRFHPILKRVKAHRGIDYRAATGTPVYAAGDGKVIKSGYDKYNGNHVFIQHGEKYVTKYLHFSKRKVRRGQRVKQGQTIGLVGSTGLAEAPHLHYEFLVNGVHRNSRTVSLPKAKPIAKKEMASFKQQTKSLVARLDLEDRLFVASISTHDK